MVRKRKYKFFIIAFIVISIFLIFIKIKDYKEEQITYMHPISIIDSKEENIEYSDIEYAIKYNTVFVPMDIAFQSIFGSDYISGTNQTISYNGTNVIIDLENSKITIPNIENTNNELIDNSVDVEIENINNINYIPVYLLSNLPKVIVKIDNKEVYNAKKYLSSFDAINDGKEEHKVEIFINQEKDDIDTTYFGEQDGALWREEAYKRIEKYRKSDVNLRVFNSNNEEITNTDIAIDMKSNNFKFGTATDKENVDNIEKKYFNTIISENFNKWRVVSQSGYTQGDNIYNSSISNGYNYKVHNLWWDYKYSEEVNALVMSDNKDDLTFQYIYNKYNNKEINDEEANSLIDELTEKFEKIVYAHIEDMAKRYHNAYEIDVINEPYIYQYFKYYLFDKKLLTDNSFLNSSKKRETSYKYNENYDKFMAKCFDIAKENNNAIMILNDNTLTGNKSSSALKYTIDLINNTKNYTSNIDSYGVQYHNYMNYIESPLSYYNNVNYFIEKTGISDIKISEYDNYKANKSSYTTAENKDRANYLKDAVTMAYSNKNISEFSFWVFYRDSVFSKEEREAYKNTVYPWLNYSEKGTTNSENGYNTSLYRGSYTANVTLPNGKVQSIDFNVGSEDENIVKFV